MTILTMNESGVWTLDYGLEPVEFWPYTTYVRERIFSGPRKLFEELHNQLIKMFRDAGIMAHMDNKSAFALRSPDFGLVGQPKLFYFGFKDFNFDLGLSIQPDKWLKPVVKKSEETP